MASTEFNAVLDRLIHARLQLERSEQARSEAYHRSVKESEIHDNKVRELQTKVAGLLVELNDYKTAVREHEYTPEALRELCIAFTHNHRLLAAKALHRMAGIPLKAATQLVKAAKDTPPTAA